MLLTVSGLPGSGTTTNAAAIADRFGLEHISGGDIFRQLAEERGHTLGEFNELAESNPEIDRDLDQRLFEIARDRDDVVLESRLAGWLAAEHATLRLWLDAPRSVRAARIAEREDKTVQQAHDETREREASERRRYQEYYDIDIDDLSIYDLSLNTARWGPEAAEEVLFTAIDAHDPADDEGAVPIEGVSYEF
jgi:cytidylate kinase